MSLIPEHHCRLFLNEYLEDLEIDAGLAYSMYGVESPIEQALLIALIHRSCARAPWFVVSREGVSLDSLHPEQWHNRAAIIIPQLQFGSFRADFAVVIRAEDRAGQGFDHVFIGECDGHDWHERTPEQAERDKARDRFFVEHGHPVMRFTGREIWRDPLACARQVETVIENKWHDLAIS